MAKKLFALEEEDTLKNNKLLVDKLLEYTQKEPSPVSITAKILKEREELKKDIQEQLNKPSETTSSSSSTEETESEEEPKSTEEEKEEPKESQEDETEDSEEESKEEKEENKESTDKSEEDKSKDSKDESKEEKSEESKENAKEDADEEDETEVAADKESLKSIIGSGLSGKEAKEKEEKKEVSKESLTLETKKVTRDFSFSSNYTPNKVTLSNIFKPIKEAYSKYLVALEGFNLPYRLSLEEQPIAYTKDAVLESLNNVIKVANDYISKNNLFIDRYKGIVEQINKQLVILKEFVEARKYHFTMKIISDQDLLSNISVENTSDIRDTIKIMFNYLHDSNTLVNMILNNKFDAMGAAATSSHFVKENTDYTYSKMLPGFNKVKLALDNYENYVKAKIENFQYYKVRTFKITDLYNLDGISITEDKELDYIVENMDKLFVELSMMLDNFNVVNENFHKLIDSIKVKIYDAENNKVDNLAGLGIDEIIKDFIKFKITSEVYVINVELIVSYLLNAENVIYKAIELKN